MIVKWQKEVCKKKYRKSENIVRARAVWEWLGIGRTPFFKIGV